AAAASAETRRSRSNEPDFEPMRRTVNRLMEDLAQVMRDLDGLSTTARGQLSAVQRVNRTAGRLSERASELHQLMASFEV
ncbi:MAG: methyl-accepting chemotaxis protein, partial [Alicyclobacillus mali]|nr:methyl-accepting chemotaxis protein [Alicyclobacillus mali (ex Roth et al. 2021)]